MTVTLSTIPGLSNVKKVDGFYVGWAWATEIQHPDFRPVLAKLGDYRIGVADSDISVHVPIRELQIEFNEVNGTQGVEFTALIQEYVSGEGFDEFTEDTELETMVRDFFVKLFDEAV